MKTPQAMINYILECFPYMWIPTLCSYHIHSMSYGTLNMVGGHLKNTNLMIILHKVSLYEISFRNILTITYQFVLLYNFQLYGIVID